MDICPSTETVLIQKGKGTCTSCLTSLDGVCPGGSSCTGDCLSCYRMASPCDCTCNTMGFELLIQRTPAEDCVCEEPLGPRAGNYISSVVLGWNDATAGHTLADAALATAPEDPRVLYYLYGSVGELKCVTDVTGLDRIPWGGVGPPAVYELVDLVAQQASMGGVFNWNITDGTLLSMMGIDFDGEVTDPPPTNCNQKGGYATLVIVAKNTRCQTLVMCPFPGAKGKDYICTKNCCHWGGEIEIGTCDVDGGTAFINLTYTLGDECDCPPAGSVIVTIGGGAPTTYDLDHSPYLIALEATPCFAGEVITITFSETFSDPPDYCTVDCHDTTFTSTFTLVNT